MASSIRVLGSNPDRIVFSDEALVKYLGDGLNDPTERISHAWIAVSQVHKLKASLDSWSGDKPSWLDQTFDESKWASRHVWNGDKVAWFLGRDRMVIQAPYALTLADSIGSLDSSYFYSSIVKGWIVKIADNDIDAVTEILSEYEITPSSALKDYLDGRGSWQSTLEEIVDTAKTEGIEPLKDFASGRTYKWWQSEAVSAMAHSAVSNSGGTLLADQVGLGKGGSFIGGHLALNDWMERTNKGDCYPVILSVTKTMKHEIAEEILKWKGDAQIQIIDGAKRDPLVEDMQYYIINHDILERRLLDILEISPKAFIADESHVFKNEDAKRTQAAQALAEAVRENTDHPYIVLASGTPFLNGPIELWSTLSILGRQARFGEYARKKLKMDTTKIHFRGPRGKMMSREIVLEDKRAFEMYFCDGHYDKYKTWYADGSSHTTELNRLLISSGMIRRRKSDVMHPLPPLTETLIKMQPDIEFMKLYYEKEEEFRSWAVDQAEIIAEEENISKKQAIRKIVGKLDNGEGMMRLTELRKTLAFGKIDGTVEWIHKFMAGEHIIQHADGHTGPISDDPARRKLIVFVHHQEPRRQLVQHPELAQYGVVTILAGSEQDGVSVQEHKELFQRDPDIRLMICTMAAREGHTLTSAKDVFLMEIPFVPSWIVQMAGRCWARLSELFDPHEATIHYAVVPETEDMKSLQRVRLKKAVFSSVIDAEGQDDTISDIREESIVDLFNDLESGTRTLTVAQ